MLLFLPQSVEPLDLVWLWVPFCHLQEARQVNFAASGALFERFTRREQRVDIDAVVDSRLSHREPPR